MNAMKQYADMGGRVLMSHSHNVWIEGAISGGTQAPAVWPTIATWSNATTTFTSTQDVVDEVNDPTGASLATWMLDTMGSTTRDSVPVANARNTCSTVDETKAEQWLTLPATSASSTQVFQFTTPNEMPFSSRCGKVLFADMHVSSDSASSPSVGFPTGCATTGLTPQEKLFAFMFFEGSGCVDVTQR
jgi:hypothetical protein